MGNFCIVIQGVGTHHNNRPDDIERLYADFVKELQKYGHSIEHASVITGGAEYAGNAYQRFESNK